MPTHIEAMSCFAKNQWFSRSFDGGDPGQADQRARYVLDAGVKHIAESMSPDWKADELVVNDWLGDVPQDVITHFVAEVLGPERLEQLVAASEAADDLWMLARRAILAGYLCSRRNDPNAFVWWRRGLDALDKLSTSSTDTEERQTQEALEMQTFMALCAATDPQDEPRIPRMLYLTEQDHLDRCACIYAFLTSRRDSLVS